MPAHKDTSGYIFPVPVDDGTRICVKVVIPNMPLHRAAFIGAVDTLCHAYNWQSDPDHNALAAAALWRGLWSEMMDNFYTNECDDMTGCCYDKIERRITPEGKMEIRVNGGAWIPDPNDPRITGITLPPPVTDEHHTKCDFASNGKQHFADYIAQEGEALSAIPNVLELAAAVAALIVALFFGQLEAIPIIVPLILAAIPALIGLGAIAWSAYWTSDEMDVILCALYCTMADDGSFDQHRLDRFVAKLRAGLTPGVAADVLINQVIAIGYKGVSNMCAYGSSADADCSSCSCECDISLWDVLECGGVIIARDDTSITVQSTLDILSGQQQCTIWSGDINQGCCSQGVEVIAGVGSLVYCYNLTGEAVNCAGFNHCGLYPNGATEVNSLLVASISAFTIKFLIGQPCE